MSNERIEKIVQKRKELYLNVRSPIPAAWMEVDFTLPQLRLLFHLYTDSDTAMSALAEVLGITMASATGLVDRLVQKGVVERIQVPEDRRIVKCRLTEQGQTAVLALWDSSFDLMKELLEKLSGLELDVIERAIDILLTASCEPEPEVTGAKAGL